MKRRRSTRITSFQNLTQPEVKTPEDPQVMRQSSRYIRLQTKPQFESDPLSQARSDSQVEQISAELHHSPEHPGQIEDLRTPSEEFCDGEYNDAEGQTSTGRHQEAPKLHLTAIDLEHTPQCIEQGRNLGDPSAITIMGLSREGKGTRGFTRLSRVWNLPEGYRVGVQFNSSFRPVKREGGLLMRFLGTCVRRPNLIPINVKSWPKVPAVLKEELWDLIKAKFEIPIAHENEIKKVLIQKAGYMWRGFKSHLRSQYFDEEKSVEEMIANVPPRVDQEQWASLIALWNTSDMKTLCQNNKALRQLQTTRHTSGPKSFAEIAEEMKDKDGVEPTEAELFLLTHKRKDGTASNEETAKKIAEMEKLVAQHQDNSQSSDEDTDWQHDSDGGDDYDVDSDYADTDSEVKVKNNKKHRKGKEVIEAFSAPSRNTLDFSPLVTVARLASEDSVRHVDGERIVACDDRTQVVGNGIRAEEDRRKAEEIREKERNGHERGLSSGSLPLRKTSRLPPIIATARIVPEKGRKQVDEEKRAYEEERKQVEEDRKKVEEDRKKVEEERKQVEEERRQAREDRRKAEEERQKSEAEIRFLKDRLTWMETLVSRLLPSTDSTTVPREIPNPRNDPNNRTLMVSGTSSHAQDY